MNPVMVFENDGIKENLRLICGTPGADTQVQTNMQTISSFIDFNFKVGESVSMPRWTHYQNLTESTIPHSVKTHINIEERFGVDPVEAAYGYEMKYPDYYDDKEELQSRAYELEEMIEAAGGPKL